MTEDELHPLGVAFLQHAEAFQSQELLEMMMGNERASVMMKQMVIEHERQSKLSGLVSKAGSSITAQLKIKGELDAICEVVQPDEQDDERVKGIGLAALKRSVQTA